MPRKKAPKASIFDLFPDEKPGAGKGFSAFSCHATHPPLVLPQGGEIRGGACTSLPAGEVDIRIGFDAGMLMSPRSYPWTPGHEFLFKIRDMEAPSDALAFRRLCEWTLEAVRSGQRVHCGCIGGHGRTGTFLAALCALDGMDDPIPYVRKTYCKKAVESAAQVAFLVKHFGVKPADGTKTHRVSDFGSSSAAKRPSFLVDHLTKSSILRPDGPAIFEPDHRSSARVFSRN